MKKAINCPIVLCQQLLSGKWKIILMYLLSQRTFRFNELQRCLPNITAATLNKQLKELLADGMIQRKAYDEIPPKVEYSLSDKGQDFTKVLESMRDFGHRHLKPED